MAERFIFSWKDETEEATVKAYAKDNGITMSEAMHRLVAQIPVIGKVDSATGVILVEGDGTLIPVDVTPEELAARE